MQRFARIVACAALAAALLAPAAAQARWLRGESDHFIVYGQMGEGALRGYVRSLEDFRRLLVRMHDAAGSQGAEAKLEIFLVNGPSDIRDVLPGSRNLAGFYHAATDGVFAVAVSPSGLFDDDVLKHEYYHHFMLKNFAGGYPGWLVEGLAEFFSTASKQGGKMVIGGAPFGVRETLREGNWIPVDELLSKNAFEEKGVRMGVYYCEAWLLANYMMVDPARHAQLAAYVRAVRAGRDSKSAWREAGGPDLDLLQGRLRTYLATGTFSMVMNPDARDDAPVSITPMPPSADVMLLEGVRLKAKVSDADRAAVLARVRADAARYPGDPLAAIVLARAELDLGDQAAAERILDERLAADPQDGEASLLKAQALMKRGDADPKAREALYDEASKVLSEALKRRQDDFRLLYAFALSRSLTPGYPSDNMLFVLQRAVELAPQAPVVRRAAADAYASRGRYDEAIAMLRPLANDPHDPTQGKAAAEAIERYERRKADATKPVGSS